MKKLLILSLLIPGLAFGGKRGRDGQPIDQPSWIGYYEQIVSNGPNPLDTLFQATDRLASMRNTRGISPELHSSLNTLLERLHQLRLDTLKHPTLTEYQPPHAQYRLSQLAGVSQQTHAMLWYATTHLSRDSDAIHAVRNSLTTIASAIQEIQTQSSSDDLDPADRSTPSQETLERAGVLTQRDSDEMWLRRRWQPARQRSAFVGYSGARLDFGTSNDEPSGTEVPSSPWHITAPGGNSPEQTSGYDSSGSHSDGEEISEDGYVSTPPEPAPLSSPEEITTPREASPFQWPPHGSDVQSWISEEGDAHHDSMPTSFGHADSDISSPQDVDDDVQGSSDPDYDVDL